VWWQQHPIEGHRRLAYCQQERIDRAQRLVEMPRPVGTYPLMWFVEDGYVGDLNAIATDALRSKRTEPVSARRWRQETA